MNESPAKTQIRPGGGEAVDIASLTGGLGLEGLLDIATSRRPLQRYTAPPGATPYRPDASEREATFEKNLRAMPSQAVRTIRKLAAAEARTDVEFFRTPEGAISAVLFDAMGRPRQLASMRKPREEAAALLDDFDPAAAGATAVLGFALGYHVEAMARVYKKTGVLLVFEPDVGLLRSVLEHIDHSDWFALRNCVIVTDAEDQGEITAAITGAEGIFMVGTRTVEHPASAVRLGEQSVRFGKTLAGALSAVRTSIVTTLVQVDKTVRNLLGNVESYVNAPGIAELANIASGKPAVVVSAGPSLRRNVELLADPAVRSRVVVIAVQTVLKTLLARGIRPDFVTALDHDAISSRFYEGLSAQDVEGVTLVVEPKASPAIFRAFPGAIRCPAEKILDSVLTGEADEETQKLLWRERGELKPGATVAHLAYYLARHLGCDPVIFIGQDLGFTDGQYYSAGAAIHQVWSGELNDFNTLEMLEWQRIARHRSLLHKRKDHLGRDCYTDEQMTTYLVQFERDFGEDAARHLRVIDATEGGLAKRHATPMPLRDALALYADAAPISLPRLASERPADARRRDALYRRLRQVRADIWKVGEISRSTAGALREILANHDDQARVNRLIHTIDRHAGEVQKLVPAYPLVQHLNQTGILNRFKADRAIELDSELDPLARQRRQAERDLTNVSWLADASDELGVMFDEVLASIRPGKRTVGPSRSTTERVGAAHPELGIQSTQRTVQAVIPVRFDRSGLGLSRPLETPVVGKLNALEATITRLAGSKRLQGLTLLTDQPERAARLVQSLEGIPPGFAIDIRRAEPDSSTGRLAAVGHARIWAGSGWRGGIANVSVFDEVFSPPELARSFADAPGAPDGLMLIGCDWCFVDPALIDQMVERFNSSVDPQRLIFTQATPGLAGCILQRKLVLDFAAQVRANGPLGSIGTILGYLPIAPQPDLIARSACVAVDPAARDAHLRLIADRGDRRELIARVAQRLGASWKSAPAAQVAALAAAERDLLRPEIVRVHLGSARHGQSSDRPLDLELMAAALHELSARDLQLAVSFEGGEPLRHPRFEQAVEVARKAGAVSVHVRTELLGDHDAERLLSQRPDVISIDMHADSEITYRSLRGIDGLQAVRDRVARLLEARTTCEDGLVDLWVVPRITRRDAVYSEIECFYDRWILNAGAAVIDPLPAPAPGERIQPLPLPCDAVSRIARMHVQIRPDGTIEKSAPASRSAA
ncbi:MAG: 6-hydroxymethylpterin diphosphokinase MptE-like protein [Phycisphaerales bacterium]|nr:DUF115 domain-containing protein [Planctomycetota bacterium]